MDRRALIVGSWLAKGRDKPSSQKVRSITDRWIKIFADDRYGFRSLTDQNAAPVPFHNPAVADLITQLEGAQDLTNETELLLYFVGHSVSSGEQDIEFILKTDTKGEDRRVSLDYLFQSIRANTVIRRLVLLLDTCHAGRPRLAFEQWPNSIFVMSATGDAYAYEAIFSEGLLRALEQPLRKNDQRIDRRAGGITYRKIFEAARRHVTVGTGGSERRQDPICFGNYGDEILVEAPASVPDGFNEFVSERSIYGRIFRLLHIIREFRPSWKSLRMAIDRDLIFLLQHDETGPSRFISNDRVGQYVDFLRRAKWLVQPNGRFELTPSGLDACDVNIFNKLLLSAIEKEVLSGQVNFALLDAIVKDLLDDMIPPTPVRIKDRAAMKGKIFHLDTPTRVALQLLPATGMFLKGAADAIFPSELGG